MRSDLVIVIPAAGASKRLGTAKQQVIIDDQPLWLRQLNTATALGFPVVLATGVWQPSGVPVGVNTVQVPEPNRGMAYSIRCAIAAAPPPRLGYLVLLIDQYQLTTHRLAEFIGHWDKQTTQLSRHQQYLGPPTIFPTKYTQQLLALDGEYDAKQLALSHPHCFYDYPECAADIDTPADLQLAQQKQAG